MIVQVLISLFLTPFYALDNGNAKQNAVICLRQLLRNVLVEDFLHGQGDDDFVAAL